MLMGVVIVLLCLQEGLTKELEYAKPRIAEEESKVIGSQVEEPLEGLSDQNEASLEADYEEQGDGPGFLGIEGKENNSDETEKNYEEEEEPESRGMVSPRPRRRSVISPQEKTISGRSDFVEPETIGEEESDGANIERDEELNEMEFDNSEGTNMEPRQNDRTKRLSMNSKSEARSTFRPFDLSYDSFISERNPNDYEEKEAIVPDELTPSISEEEKPIASVDYTQGTTGFSEPSVPNIKATIKIVEIPTDDIGIKKYLAPEKGFIHGMRRKYVNHRQRKKKINKARAGSPWQPRNMEDLNKAYSELVCAVEKFMERANKSMVYNSGVGKTGSSGIISQNVAAGDELGTFKDGSHIFTPPLCTTPRALKPGEVSVICDTEANTGCIVERNEENEDQSNIKRSYKSSKNENQMPEEGPEHGSAYDDNYYDGVDSNEDYKEGALRSTYSEETSWTSAPKREKSNEEDSTGRKVLLKKVLSRPKQEESQNAYKNESGNSEAASESFMEASLSVTPAFSSGSRGTESHWNTRGHGKMRQSRLPKLRRRKVRKKYMTKDFPDVQDVSKSLIDVITRSPIRHNLPYNPDVETEIVELDYT